MRLGGQARPPASIPFVDIDGARLLQLVGVMEPWRRTAIGALRQVDHALGRAFSPLRVLVESRTPMNLAVLAPIWKRLLDDPRVDVRFTGPDRSDLSAAFAHDGLSRRRISRARASLARWDLYLNADPWDPVPLRRCRRRLNFFHGVAGKYNLECPVGLPMSLAQYDRVAFPNTGRMQRYVAAGLVRAERAALVGFPKLDALVNDPVLPQAKAAALGLDAQVPTVIYAPTFSPQSSLLPYGEGIVRRLLARNLNVIVKLHDRSLDPDPAYSGGIDWRARFAVFGGTTRFLFASSGDSTDYLLAADVMVTDHSTVGFEFCALDRPLVVVDMPALLEAARVDPGKARLLRDAADVVNGLPDLDRAVDDALGDPGARRAERRAAVEDVFYDPGRATARALALCYELLERPLTERVRLSAGARSIP